MIRALALLLPIALTAAAPTSTAARTQKDVIMQHATGTFEVKITPEAQGDAPAGGVATSRMALAKTFSGGLVGEATGTMIAAGMPLPGNAAAYVAIDQFHGTLDGHAGGFILVHRGTMTKTGAGDLSIVIAPDSGTGALEGITGTLAIEMAGGKHSYDLAYSLPAKR